MRRTNLAAGAALALLGGIAACGQTNDTVGRQTSTGSGGGGFGGFGGGVSCSAEPDQTGCPCTAGETRACYTGPAATRGVAPCKDGVQTCTEQKELTYVFGPCTGEILPSATAACVPDSGAPDSGTPDSGTPDSGTPDSGVPCTADLTSDPLNCGSCGHGCCGGACVGGTCQPRVLVAQTRASGSLLVVDDTSVYWNDGSLKKVAKTGGTPVTLVPSVIVLGLAVDATSVYFTDSQGLKSVPISGGTVTTLSAAGAGSLVMDAKTLYWLQSTSASPGQYNVMSMPKAGGTPTVLYGPLGSTDNCATGECLVAGLSIDATSLYWSTVAAPNAGDAQADTKSRILKLPKTGGTPVTLRTGEPANILLDGTSMYVQAMPTSTSGVFHYVGPNRLLRMSVNGGATTTILDPFSEVEAPSPLIAADAANLYYVVESPSNSIVSLPKSGAPAVTLASAPALPYALAADAACIYWLDFGSSSSLSVVAK